MATSTHVVWKPEFSVQNQELDGQHRRMFDLLNELYGALEDGAPARPIEQMLADAREYALTHFKHEEALMEQSGYPGLEAHRREHQAYLARVVVMSQDVKSSSDDKACQLFLFLQQWWLGHLTQVDRDYIPSLQQAAAAKK